MNHAHTELREGVQLEQQKLQARLKRLHDTATRSVFPTSVTRLAHCRSELAQVVPLVVQHLAREDDLLRRIRANAGAGRRAEVEGNGAREIEMEGRADSLLDENASRLKELRALLETAKQLLDEHRKSDGEGGEGRNVVAEAMAAYLAACVGDLLKHEATQCPFLPKGPFVASERSTN